jgi:thiamine biosynthesis lipoprotein
VPPAEAEVRRVAEALARAAPYQAGQDYGPSLAVQWDFGALPRAAALEEALARLKDAGIGNAMINFGGVLRTRGQRGTAPWRIGLRNPRARGASDVLAYVLTGADEAVSTRGDDERFFESGGQRYHDVLDPRTGAPAPGLQSVTVIAPDAVSAAVASQALFVAGPGGWRDLARTLAVAQAMVVTAGGDIKVTAALNQRLKFMRDRQASVEP